MGVETFSDKRKSNIITEKQIISIPLPTNPVITPPTNPDKTKMDFSTILKTGNELL